jgi:glycosyltransferase involved in cell wall biosynthesis
LEVGLHDNAIVDESSLDLSKTGPLKLLFIGRFLYWKGGDLALDAFAIACQRGVNAELTLVGQGPERRRWQRRAAQLGISDKITWIAWMPQHDLATMYASHQALLFPSLHDSSGNVVLEALGMGMAVICLDMGGPAEIVDDDCAIKVSGFSNKYCDVVLNISAAIESLAENRERLNHLRSGALARARTMKWNRIVTSAWAPLNGCSTELKLR